MTCVDSAHKLEMLSSIGADHVMDYEKEDFTQNEQQYDVVIDIAGKSNYSRTIRSLKPHGRYVLGNPPVSGMFRSLWTGWITDKKVLWEFAADKVEDLDYIKELMVSGQIKSVIDKRYPLENVPEAHRYVDEGLKAGNVVIDITHNS